MRQAGDQAPIVLDFGPAASTYLSGFLVAMSLSEDRLFLVDFDACGRLALRDGVAVSFLRLESEARPSSGSISVPWAPDRPGKHDRGGRHSGGR